MQFRLALLFFICFASVTANGQRLDSLILYENTLTRPLNAHARQFRLGGMYNYGLNLKRFDDTGEGVNLYKNGISSISNLLGVQLQYGLTENLQLSTSISYFSLVERLQTRYIDDDRSPNGRVRIEENITHESKGMEDILVSADYRMSVKKKRIHDLMFSSGIILPVFAHEPKQPEVSLHDTPDIISTHNDVSLDVVNRQTNGKGVYQYRLGFTFKYRFKKMGVTLNTNFQSPLGNGKSYRWQYRLASDSSIQFKTQDVSYLLSNRVSCLIGVERQFFPWLNASVVYNSDYQFGGWTSSSAVKVTNQDVRLHTLTIGYELIVTQKVWFRQSLSTPIAGLNSRAPLLIGVSIVYNFWI